MDIKYAYFAGGCFWGVEYHFNKQEGVLDALSGFMGGHTKNPTYQDICYKDTGHLEVVEVKYDSDKINYEDLAKLFFEIHDPSQTNGQGPDIGSQYLSAVFTSDDEEKKTVEKLIKQLEESGLHVATKILEKQEFYKAEDYHQYYYSKTGKTPYCHSYTRRFVK
jgi:methionine-S-sulfoxide reductase